MSVWRQGKKLFCAGILLLVTMLAVGTVACAANVEGSGDTGLLESMGDVDSMENTGIQGDSGSAGNTDPVVVSETEGNSFDGLKAAAQTGGSYTLTGDITGTIDTSIQIVNNFTLDLNGHTLSVTSAASSNNLFVVSGTFTLQDLSDAKTGVLKFDGGDNAVSVSAGGIFNLEGGTITLETSVRAVFARGTINMSGGVITRGANSVCGGDGGGILMSGGILNMSGGKISGNKAQNGGGIAAKNGSKVTISGTAEISANKANTINEQI